MEDSQSQAHSLVADFPDGKRNFQVWAYTVSHAQLLLRSTRGDDHPTRIDMGFKNTKALSVSHLMPELHIEEADPQRRLALLADVGLPDDSAKCFLLRWTGGNGYVIAGVMVTHEADLDHSAPSEVFKPFLD